MLLVMPEGPAVIVVWVQLQNTSIRWLELSAT